MDFLAYYSNSTDFTPPVIEDPGAGAVLHERTETGLTFRVTAQDNEELFRVIERAGVVNE